MTESVFDDDYADMGNDDAKSVNSFPQGAIDRSASEKAWLSYCITSLGNFSVQYNFQAISVALLIMATEQCTSTEENCRQGKQEAWVEGTAAATVFAGAIFGQLSMGYMGDLVGRNKALTMTLSLAAVSAMLSAILPMGDAKTVYIVIIICRFALGIGLGGVYPLAATKAAEDAAAINTVNTTGNENSVDSTSAAKAFFWQGPGAMGPWVLALLMSYNQNLSTSSRWRLVLGLGSVPAALVVLGSLYENLERPEKLETRVSISMSQADASEMRQSLLDNSNKEAVDGAIEGGGRAGSLERQLLGDDEYNYRREVNIWVILGQWKYQRKLIATCIGWFFYDVCFYGVNLFGGQILADINSNGDDNVTTDKSIRDVAGKQMIAFSMAIPGVLLTILCLTHFPTKYIHVVGFLLITLGFLLLAFLIEPLRDDNTALFSVYCILLFALNSGPNVTTFVLPSETYPKGVRATCNGISAAMGKLGAVVGAYMFGPLALATSFVFVFIVCAAVAAAGALVGWSFIDLQHSHGVASIDETAVDKEDDKYYGGRSRAESYRRDSGGDLSAYPATGPGAPTMSLSRAYQ